MADTTEIGGLLRQQMLKMQEDHANQMAEMNAKFDQLIGKPTVVMQAVEKPEDAEKKIERLRLEMELARREIEATLADGPQVFECACSAQPKLTKLVGAVDGDVARAKYERYSGITAIMDPKVKITVKGLGPNNAPKTEKTEQKQAA